MTNFESYESSPRMFSGMEESIARQEEKRAAMEANALAAQQAMENRQAAMNNGGEAPQLMRPDKVEQPDIWERIPETLQDLDRTLGTDTKSAWVAAVKTEPALEQVYIMFTDTRYLEFSASPDGLPASDISLSSIPDRYPEIGGESFREMYAHYGLDPDNLNERVTRVLLHELGHARQLKNEIDKAGGDTRKAFWSHIERTRSQLHTLPLKTSSGQADEYWRSNTDGYRDRLQQRGITEDKWWEMLRSNNEAYRELEIEKGADEFALYVRTRVLAEKSANP